ncbi:hypothetical protein KIN20_005061 [Parelaphostrongylus tenuis]|uniref:Phosphatidylethanolamine-binding protein n=1 Tax=Parelaphostrongylus tenuis TaxID=148309 RepID=A0AAD5MS81_PARTN|nr:hypothetical protein KIN20_005061 [Parelaphostrongylus tenuis]
MGYMYLLLPLLLVFYQRIYCHSDRPGYIKPETMPLRVTYDRNSEVQFGNILSPSATSSQPRLMWEASSSSLYTVLMIDPDAPSRADPSFRDFLHWLVVNVPGDELSRGFTAAPYRGPGPPKGTGFHRYYFLVFEQPKTLQNIETRESRDSRKNFNTTEFVMHHGLGNAVAWNFFKAQYMSK